MNTCEGGVLQEGALNIVKVLSKAGYRALWAGGCVRDLLLKRPPQDYDIATEAEPQTVLNLFSGREGVRANFVGEAFGVVRVETSAGVFQVTRFRKDDDYQDGRHPLKVEPAWEMEDATRRDFTVNGMFMDPLTNRVIDYVGGERDLSAQVIRAIGEAGHRFQEDHLRMLRAIRFAARLNWPIHQYTFDAIRPLAEHILRISQERVRDELIRILTEGGAPLGIRLLIECGLAKHVIPEIQDMEGVPQPSQFHPEGDVLVHTLIMLSQMRSPSPELAFGVLLHDVGKPSTYQVLDRIRFNNHTKVGAVMAESICRRLRMSNEQVEHIRRLVADHHRFASVHDMRPSKFKQFLRTPRFDDHLELHRLDCLSSNRNFDSYRFCLEARDTMTPEDISPEPLITGKDLIDLGYAPGPAFRVALSEVQERQLEGTLIVPEDALEVARGILEQSLVSAVME